jgi:hypothetical protein
MVPGGLKEHSIGVVVMVWGGVGVEEVFVLVRLLVIGGVK